MKSTCALITACLSFAQAVTGARPEGAPPHPINPPASAMKRSLSRAVLPASRIRAARLVVRAMKLMVLRFDGAPPGVPVS